MAEVALIRLSKRFGGHLAVDGVDLSVADGELVCMLGPSGCGKSTTLRLIAGFIEPSEGEVRVGGKRLSWRGGGLPPERRNMSMIFQSYALWPHMTVAENIAYGLTLRKAGRETIARKLDAILATTKLAALAERYPGELSGGQKKRVFLARALAQEGRIILLDEPFTGVDVKTETAIIELMRELRDAGHLMLVSTHNLGSVPDFCDQVVLVNRTVLASGPTADVFTQENLERAFGGVLRHFHLGGPDLHDDSDTRRVTVLTDDERPVVFYGQDRSHKPASPSKHGDK